MPENPEIKYIPISKLTEPSTPLRPLKNTLSEYYELRDAIRDSGLNSVAVVRKHKTKPGYYEVVTGWHRCNASKDLGLTEMPCIVRDYTDKEVIKAQIEENAVSIPTERMEYARHLYRLYHDTEGVTVADLANMVNKSVKWVYATMSLEKIDPRFDALINTGKLTFRKAYALAKLPKTQQSMVIDDALSMGEQEFEHHARALYKALACNKEGRRLSDIYLEDFFARPKLRSISAIKKELSDESHLTRVLLYRGAKTPLDGAKAALEWAIHQDPESIEKQKEKILKNRKESDPKRQSIVAEQTEDINLLDQEFFNWDDDDSSSND